jgi:alkylation response protein AidB-like acyl-CoA dehydrogenase
MDFELTEEQKSLRALIKDFCEREIDWKHLHELGEKKVSLENARDTMPWDLVEKLHNIGLRQLGVPRKYGGGEAGWLTKIVVAEALAHWGGPLGVLMTPLWKWCRDLAAYASDELQDEFFPKFMNDSHMLLSSALTEADAGCDIELPYDGPGNRVSTFAYKDGDEWVINGTKVYISGGPVADYLAVMAITDKNKPYSESVAVFMMPKDTPGFSVIRINDFIIQPMMANGDLLFENCRIPNRYLLAEPGKASAELMEMRRTDKIIHLGEMLGRCQSIYELTKEHAKTRIQGGKPIFEHLNIGPLVVEMGILIETFRLLLYRCAWELDREEEKGLKISQMWYNLPNAYVKLQTPRLVSIVTEVFGGMGMLKEFPVESWVRSIILYNHIGGTRTMDLIKTMPVIEDLRPVGTSL